MIDYQLVKTISFYCKYVGLVATAVLGWINLHYKTTHEADGLTLTPAGKVSRGILIASVVITASSAILENTADSKLRKLAEDQGNRSVAAALQAQHQSYINDLKDQIEGRLLPKIEEETRKLELAADRISSTVTGSKGFV